MNIKKSQLFNALILALSLSATAPALSSAIPSTIINQQDSLAPMLEKVIPAVVSVHVEGVQTQKQKLPDEFKFFFGPNFPTERQDTRPFESLGSGVIIDAIQGYIVTNNHVIQNADKIRVQLNNGREFDAKLIGRDEQSDIALLQIKEAKDLTAITIADSDLLRVGDFAIAIGNPFGLGQTATSGIISALGRSGLNMQGLENYIQTDASINRGNSGGALINLKGELIGMNAAIIAPNGGNVGIGFAIPSTMVKSLTQQLIEFGEVRRGQLGIRGGEMNADMSKALQVDIQKGAFVSIVDNGSAAEKAGIKPGDVIISFNGKVINSFAELRAKVAIAGAGQKVVLGLVRDGQSRQTEVTLQQGELTSAITSTNKLFEGVTFKDGELNDNKGIFIENIHQNSRAYSNGLRKGDFIISINKTRTQTIKELQDLVKSQKDTLLALNIQRENNNLYLILK